MHARVVMDKLTELSIKQSKSKKQQYKIFDGGGMFLLVHPNGSKYWRMNFKFEGKFKLLSFGVWPDVSLREARERRFDAKKKVREGINPIEENREIKKLKLEAIKENKNKLDGNTKSFQKVAIEWYKRQATHWTEKHSIDVYNSLKFHVFPDLGNKTIALITKQEVISILRKLETEGKYETCYRVRQRLEAVFEFAEISEYCEVNPAGGLQKIFTKPQPKSHHSLPISELPELLAKIEADKVTSRSNKLAMKFLILTFVRSSELRFADWNEFDIDRPDPLWLIPSERMKMRKMHHVPLSSHAVAILEEMRQFSGPDGYVFTQLRNPQKAISENTLLYFSNRLGYAGRNTIHGFRIVASTVLNECGMWRPDAIEAQLAHKEPNKIRGTYNRAEYLEERRKLMQWWGDYINSHVISPKY